MTDQIVNYFTIISKWGSTAKQVGRQVPIEYTMSTQKVIAANTYVRGAYPGNIPASHVQQNNSKVLNNKKWRGYVSALYSHTSSEGQGGI